MPKGVTVTHAGLANLARETADRLRVSSTSRVLHFSSPSFDGAVLDLLLAWGGAATLVVAPPGTYGGTDLARVLATERITHAFVTTSALAITEPRGLDDLSHVLVGGEACPPDLVGRWAPGRMLCNVYGPTETTVVTTMSPAMVAGRTITIGGPIRGAVVMVLDDRLNPVPIGVPGELYLAGPGLARGYHRRAALTAERFVANPYGSPGERMYRSGDRVRWSPHTAQSEIEYLGRTDHQVKIRGFRIEPGEIDAVLTRHPDVEFSLTLGHEMPSGATVLVSYVKPVTGAVVDAHALRAHVSHQLPNYLVPQSITPLDSLPLNPVGKLDRHALPEPVFAARQECRSPRTPVESALCQAFAAVLGMDTVSTGDSFFELGGNSLMATRVVAMVRQRHGIEMPVPVLFLDPTPAGIARRLEAGNRTTEDALDAALRPVLPIRPQGTKPPLFCVHPGIGLSWCYAGMLPYLDKERPVYGLQSPHVTEERSGFDSIEQIAGRYVTEIRKVQPTGPYHLLGWSLGGLIAHAMAVQLTASGDTVPLLSMMDSIVLSAAPAADVSVAELLAEFGIDPGTSEAEVTLERAADLLRHQPGPLGALRVEHLERIHAGYLRATEMARRFRPGLHDGDLLFFTAAAADPRHRREPTGDAAVWRPFVRGAGRHCVVPGAVNSGMAGVACCWSVTQSVQDPGFRVACVLAFRVRLELAFDG